MFFYTILCWGIIDSDLKYMVYSGGAWGNLSFFEIRRSKSSTQMVIVPWRLPRFFSFQYMLPRFAVTISQWSAFALSHACFIITIYCAHSISNCRKYACILRYQNKVVGFPMLPFVQSAFRISLHDCHKAVFYQQLILIALYTSNCKEYAS